MSRKVTTFHSPGGMAMKTFALLVALVVTSLLLPVTPTAAKTITYLPVVVDNSICRRARDIPKEECIALVDIYESTDGPDWRASHDWLVTPNPCTWYGVICEERHVV